MTKYALLIGINYKGKKFALKGCINDTYAIKSLINSWGFEDRNITIMNVNTQI
jgi:hypothetical protein